MMPASRLVRSTWLIASLTLVSRLLGLGREVMYAYLFGTSEILSSFRIAFMIPNLGRRLFGEGALSAAMIPVLTDSLKDQGEPASRRFVGALLTLLLSVLIGVVATVEVVIACLYYVHADAALRMSAILMPYMIMICTVAMLGGVLNVKGHFAAPAALPVILNLAIIAGGGLAVSIGGCDSTGTMNLICAAVLVGGAVQVAVILTALRSAGFTPLVNRAWRDPRVRRVLVLMAPMLLGLSAVQINSLADYVIAYLFVSSGGERVGPAVLGYAQYLYQLPLGVFGIAVATAIFPELSGRAADGDEAGVANTLVRGLRMSVFIALPASVGLMFVARPLVATLLQHGANSQPGASRIAGALWFYSVGIVAYFAQHVLVRTFYAIKDSRTPARIAAYMVVVNLALNLSLVGPMEERGLALATAICSIAQVMWLWTRLHKRLPTIHGPALMAGAGRMALATAGMATYLSLFFLDAIRSRLPGGEPLILAMMVPGGAAIYAIMAYFGREKAAGG